MGSIDEILAGSKMNNPLNNEDAHDLLIEQWSREIPDASIESMAVVGRIQYLGAIFEKSVNRVLKEYKLRYTDFNVLATLRRAGAPFLLTPTQLRKTVLISSGAMTAVLDQLERVGLIARVADASDRRVKAAELTSAGILVVEQAVVARLEDAKRLIDGLSTTEQAELAQLLKKIVKSVQ